VRCGACARVCLSGTLQVARRGWRIQIGGRLGRHPRLGVELPGLHARAGVLAAAGACIDFFLRNATAGERFGELLERVGDGTLRACIRERTTPAPQLPPRTPAPILRGPV
jgi:dissimilatory sulfite reductase (desulfoviridin) alpha/beta subunit